MKSRQIGRGGKRGKTSGRGTKGQKARAGRKLRPEMRDMIKKLPKLRGYSFKSIEEKSVNVSIANLEKSFDAGSVVSPITLLEKGLIEKRAGRTPSVKVLSDGEISKKLTLEGVRLSASAKEKIEKAGGTVK